MLEGFGMVDVFEPPWYVSLSFPDATLKTDPSSIVFHRSNIPQNIDWIFPKTPVMNKAAGIENKASKRAAIFFNAG
jgi:hypothetical protein